jgi:hypothetical protein
MLSSVRLPRDEVYMDVSRHGTSCWWLQECGDRETYHDVDVEYFISGQTKIPHCGSETRVTCSLPVFT